MTNGLIDFGVGFRNPKIDQFNSPRMESMMFLGSRLDARYASLSIGVHTGIKQWRASTSAIILRVIRIGIFLLTGYRFELPVGRRLGCHSIAI